MSQIKEETEKADETLTPQKLNDMMELAPGFDSQKEENKQYSSISCPDEDQFKGTFRYSQNWKLLANSESHLRINIPQSNEEDTKQYVSFKNKDYDSMNNYISFKQRDEDNFYMTRGASNRYFY